VGIIFIITTSFRSSFQYDPLGILSPWFGILYIVFAGIYFIPVYYLYRFSNYAKQSLVQINTGGSSNELMSHAIDYLKRHFRFVGILTIVMLALYILGIIGVIIAFAVR